MGFEQRAKARLFRGPANLSDGQGLELGESATQWRRVLREGCGSAVRDES